MSIHLASIVMSTEPVLAPRLTTILPEVSLNRGIGVDEVAVLERRLSVIGFDRAAFQRGAQCGENEQACWGVRMR